MEANVAFALYSKQVLPHSHQEIARCLALNRIYTHKKYRKYRR